MEKAFHIPRQFGSLHVSIVELEPSHSSPPKSASTFFVRVSFLVPSPHVTEQSPIFQSSHTQWTAEKKNGKNNEVQAYNNMIKCTVINEGY